MQIIQEAADEFAWTWVLERAVWRLRGATPKGEMLVKITRKAKGEARVKEWNGSESSINISAKELALSLLSDDFNNQQQIFECLKKSADDYVRLRTRSNLWLECMGKEVLDKIPERLGLTSAQIVEQQVIHLWESREVPVPEELQQLREFVNGDETTDKSEQEPDGPVVSAEIAPY